MPSGITYPILSWEQLSNPLLFTDSFHFSQLILKLNSFVMLIKNHYDVMIKVEAMNIIIPLFSHFPVKQC